MAEQEWEVLPPEDPSRPDPSSAACGRRARLATAFAVAAVSDGLSAWLEFVPPVQAAIEYAARQTDHVVLQAS